MHWRNLLMAVLAAGAAMTSGCRQPAEEPSPDVTKEVKALQEQKDYIAEKLYNIERSRALLEANTDEELRKMREQLELVQIALGKIEERLAALGAVSEPMTSAKPQRLPLEATVILSVIFVCSAVLYWKMRSVRLRETRQPRAKGVVREAAKESPES